MPSAGAGGSRRSSAAAATGASSVGGLVSRACTVTPVCAAAARIWSRNAGISAVVGKLAFSSSNRSIRAGSSSCSAVSWTISLSSRAVWSWIDSVCAAISPGWSRRGESTNSHAIAASTTRANEPDDDDQSGPAHGATPSSSSAKRPVSSGIVEVHGAAGVEGPLVPDGAGQVRRQRGRASSGLRRSGRAPAAHRERSRSTSGSRCSAPAGTGPARRRRYRGLHPSFAWCCPRARRRQSRSARGRTRCASPSRYRPAVCCSSIEAENAFTGCSGVSCACESACACSAAASSLFGGVDRRRLRQPDAAADDSQTDTREHEAARDLAGALALDGLGRAAG